MTLLLTGILLTTILCTTAYGGIIGTIIKGVGIISDITDLALSIGNVISGGCQYVPEICDLKPQIERLERQLKPTYSELDRLDDENHYLYWNLTDIIQKRMNIAKIQDKLEYLAVSVVRRLGDPQLTDSLAADFEVNANRLTETYRYLVDEYEKMAKNKLWLQLGINLSKRLYYGLKYTYKELKARNLIKIPTDFKNQLSKISQASLTTIPMPSKFTSAKAKLDLVSDFLNRPSVRKYRGYIADAGVLVGSLFNLGVSVTIDVIMARRIRDELRRTRNELSSIKNDMDAQLAKERQVNVNLKDVLYEEKKIFVEMANYAKQMMKLSFKTSFDVVNKLSPVHFNDRMTMLITSYLKLHEEMSKMKISLETVDEIKISVEWNDSLARIEYGLKLRGWDVNRDTILTVIAREFPKLNSYDGISLQKYRG